MLEQESIVGEDDSETASAHEVGLPSHEEGGVGHKVCGGRRLRFINDASFCSWRGW